MDSLALAPSTEHKRSSRFWTSEQRRDSVIPSTQIAEDRIPERNPKHRGTPSKDELPAFLGLGFDELGVSI
ncbi:uncharacterized protein ACLA_005490 [Aspergillus clavatus NRRL 1]|uniref:Uncharacterized protein n=1 Tax=Aspergillus clavatus (strain ATCC 1007 / CBS 513.65 / DSM 816 / NCTC 3887 / NRRL 1 / QM 1276 / 107) TaxID=344612 RepID=A1CD66_ASPCL|nr:uncharacterized protein ACLA_005490 [Aspergillus clavatus NRRL 1]EAW11793.1 hypothetical protein ACLA_005490 [Aspergillus clavatus NRRL 1]